MKLILMRHGETLFNKKNLIQGQCDSPLTKEGINDSIKVGEILNNYDINTIYSSNLTRCIRTTDLILDQLADSNPTVFVDERIGELDIGIEEGEKIKDMLNRYPTTLDITKEIKIPQAEDWKKCVRRFEVFLQDLKVKHQNEETILVVSHSLILGAFLSHIFKLKKLMKIKNNEVIILDMNHYNNYTLVKRVTN